LNPGNVQCELPFKINWVWINKVVLYSFVSHMIYWTHAVCIQTWFSQDCPHNNKCLAAFMYCLETYFHTVLWGIRSELCEYARNAFLIQNNLYCFQMIDFEIVSVLNLNQLDCEVLLKIQNFALLNNLWVCDLFNLRMHWVICLLKQQLVFCRICNFEDLCCVPGKWHQVICKVGTSVSEHAVYPSGAWRWR